MKIIPPHVLISRVSEAARYVSCSKQNLDSRTYYLLEIGALWNEQQYTILSRPFGGSLGKTS